MGRKIQNCRIVDDAVFHGHAVDGGLVTNHQKIFQIREIHVVMKNCGTFFLVKREDTHGTVYILELQESRMRCAVRIN